MTITSITVGPFEENCYILVDDLAPSRDAVLVDPGDEGSRILREVELADAQIKAVWLTHAHIDHIGAVAAVRRVWDVPVYLHPLDRPLYDRGAQQAARFGLAFEQPEAPDRTLADGDILEVGALRFTVLHVPGHSPGHVGFLGHGVLFGGDCLFAGSVGRTDLPFCDPAEFEKSLQLLCALPPDTSVRPGHGPATTIGAELRGNPFLSSTMRRQG